MKIHEHQAKELFQKYGISTSKGRVAFSVTEAVEGARNLQSEGVKGFVVKAQIHAGGRGKGGGVKLAKDIKEVEELSKSILGMQLVTHQTGPSGQKVKRIWVEEANPPLQEFYLSMVLDREHAGITILCSKEGGMDIEELAAKEPEKILNLQIPYEIGLKGFHSSKVANFLGLTEKHMIKQLGKMLSSLYLMILEKDCSIVEVNPLAVVSSGENKKLIALDAKVNFDENALPRHPDILSLRDLDEEDPSEVEASNYDLNYIALDGEIGCMVNGAGLAMATMDIIKAYGSEPANFLDVGGGATAEKVTAAFKIILKDPKVKAIFVNIFGGIMKCDVIAEGITQAANDVSISVPLIVRLEGTNVEKGREILQNSGLDLISANSMSDGAKKAVAAVS